MTRYLMLLCLLASPAHALEFVLRVDGEQSRTIQAESAAMAITDERIVVDVRTGDGPDPEPPVPPEPPAPTGCGPVPDGVQIGAAINWAQPGGQSLHTIRRLTAWPFRATGNPAYLGQVSTVEASSRGGFRRIWISRCPVGEPLGPRCEAEGRESAVVRWAQSAQRGACQLTPGERYHVNVEFLDCAHPSGCLLYRNIYTNGNP